MKLKLSLPACFSALALALAVASSPATAFAQNAAKPAPAKQPPMVLPVITPSHLAVARDVVINSGLSRSFDSIVPELMGQLYANIVQTRPELTNDLKAVLVQLQPEFQKETAKIIDVAAQAVAAQIDEKNLDQIDAFFKSPAGKAYVSAEPDMLNRMMATIHDITQQMSVHMMTRVREEMQKRGKTL